MENRNIKGIIFDMDNTLLRSTIDFPAMKKEVFQFLTYREVLPEHLDLTRHTTATLIEAAKNSTRMTGRLLEQVWEIVRKHETSGMKGACLEPGVAELLEKLNGKVRLAVITNNSGHAAESALRENGIFHYFDCVVGREMVKSIKPSPDGVFYVLAKFPPISAEEWISVGDSWIDGKAAAQAGVKFISYRGDIREMNRMGVFPIAEIETIEELLAFV